MTDLDDLIARLLGQFGAGDFAGTPPIAARHVSVMLKERAEAAAALEALRAENERLRVAAAGSDKAMRLAEGVIVAKRELFALAEARNALRAALKHQ